MSVTVEQREKWLDYTVERLDKENQQLRRRLRLSSRHARRVQRAFEDAHLLATLHVAYLPTERAHALRRGLTKRRWELAIGLLRMARVHNGTSWDSHSPDVIARRLEKALEKALDDPRMYRLYLPKYLR